MIITTMVIVMGSVSFILFFNSISAVSKHLQLPPLNFDFPFSIFPISVIKPLKGVDPNLKENLRSFFKLSYPKFELLFCIESKSDPAFSILEEISSEFKHVPHRIISNNSQLTSHQNENPKVRNMITAYETAQYPWILISDSNVLVSPDYLKVMSSQITSDAGIITSLVEGVDQSDDFHREHIGLGGWLEKTILNTLYFRSMLLAFKTQRPFAMGKSMLFKKAQMDRIDGIKTLLLYLAEDYMAGKAMEFIGLKIKLSSRPVQQIIGKLSFKEHWSRQIRWGRIRKNQEFLLFILEPLAMTIVGSLLLSWGVARICNIPFFKLFLLFQLLISLFEIYQLRERGRLQNPIRSTLIILLREILHPFLWIHILISNQVKWRNQKIRIQNHGLITMNEV